ncbi:integrin alpha-L-like isoform X2 [Dendrobates tinctorius]|uniref:integrin alpha-L-like isoform X2 n=1 Tax=Dendrobates tinctorius TaxID=92724 RepID=UPI003CCA0694
MLQVFTQRGLMDFWLLLLLSLLDDVDISFPYNVEVLEHRRFSAEVGELFGYRVVQFNSTVGERVLIGDPGSNMLHTCDVVSGTCENLILPDRGNASHLGLTLEVELVSRRCLVCGFAEPHDCSQTLYTNGACYTVDSGLTASEMSTPGYQECQKAEVDLCFLFDDSFSVGDPELEDVGKFLLSAIQNLKNSSLNFAVVKFASFPEKIFNFKDYQNGKGEEGILHMKHSGGGTNIYKAINFTLNEIFTPVSGAREHAKKILLLLSDGDSHDSNNGVIEAADQKKVTRYVIGVGKNFISLRDKIAKLASYPTDKHTEVLTDYSRLVGFFNELQSKILAIEGVAQGSNFTQEMSSAGLSAVLTAEQDILGDPGIFDWSGGILNVSMQGGLAYMSRNDDEKYGYLGYSVELLHTRNGPLYVVGSPRFQYVGLVTVLQEVSGELRWKKVDSLQGEQVGSYFGAETAVSDIDQDGVTDLVLISAPHHYELKWSGQVSVCRFVEKLQCVVTLHGEPGHLHSQFGAAVSSLGDLDGDGLTEVAVGAPYEMDGQGAVYIYKGTHSGLLLAAYSQRLLSPSGILGFGLSLHGVLDMTEDGLIDVVVGSLGHVTLHRSKPVLNVSLSLVTNQTNIVLSSLEASGCDNMLTLEACVHVEILTSKYTGSMSMSIHYNLTLDSLKPESRMFFTDKQRKMIGTVEILGPGAWCQNHTVYLQDCGVEDVSEVQVFLTAGVQQASPPWHVLQSMDLSATNLISLQICEEGKICNPDMSIKLNHSPLVLQDGTLFSLFLNLQNMNERAHQTRLHLDVPPGLSYRKANVTEASHWIPLKCGDFKEQKLACNISHPIRKRRVWAVVHIMFGVVSNVSWADRIFLATSVMRDGNKTSSSDKNEDVVYVMSSVVPNVSWADRTAGNVMRDGNRSTSLTVYEVPVLCPVHVISRSLEDSTKYVPFIRVNETAMATHRYQIKNLGLGAVLIGLTVHVSYVEVVSWDISISFSQNNGVICLAHNDSSAVQTHSKEHKTNQTWRCTMDSSGKIDVILSGQLQPITMWEEKMSASVSSTVMIHYDESRYHSDMGSRFHTAQVMTQVELLLVPDHTLYIVGGTVGGVFFLILLSILLYKCGFFRRYKDRMMEKVSPSDVTAHEPLENQSEQESDNKLKLLQDFLVDPLNVPFPEELERRDHM